jgi:hypothetical protein
LDEAALLDLLQSDDEYIRAWAIQLLSDRSKINAFQVRGPSTGIPSEQVLNVFAEMARADSSQIVRLYLASAIQRLPFDQRWPVLKGLVSHSEDQEDNNLPRMYWFGLEPMVPDYPRESLEIAIAGRIP